MAKRPISPKMGLLDRVSRGKERLGFYQRCLLGGVFLSQIVLLLFSTPALCALL